MGRGSGGPWHQSAFAGQSLFDEITSDGVPFPFDALVDKVEKSRLPTSPMRDFGIGAAEPLAAANRCGARFFSFPRVVAA